MPETKTEVCVRVLYPTALESIGIKNEGQEEVMVTESDAAWLVTAGFGELKEEPKPKPKTTKTTTTKRASRG